MSFNFDTYLRSRWSITKASLELVEEFTSQGLGSVCHLEKSFRVSTSDFHKEFETFLISRQLTLVPLKSTNGATWVFDIPLNANITPTAFTTIHVNRHLDFFDEISRVGVRRFLRAVGRAAGSDVSSRLELREFGPDFTGDEDYSNIDVFVASVSRFWRTVRSSVIEEELEERKVEFKSRRVDALPIVEKWLFQVHGLVFRQLEQLIVRGEQLVSDSDEFWSRVVTFSDLLLKDQALADSEFKTLLKKLDCELKPLVGKPLAEYASAANYLSFKSDPRLFNWEAFRVLGFWGMPGDSDRFVSNCLKYGRFHPEFGVQIAERGIRFARSLSDFDLFALAKFVAERSRGIQNVAPSENLFPDPDETTAIESSRAESFLRAQEAQFILSAREQSDIQVEVRTKSRLKNHDALSDYLVGRALNLNLERLPLENLWPSSPELAVREFWPMFSMIQSDSLWDYLDFLAEATPKDIRKIEIEARRISILKNAEDFSLLADSDAARDLMTQFLDCEMRDGAAKLVEVLALYGPRLRIDSIFQEDQRSAVSVLASRFLSDPLQLSHILNSIFDINGELTPEILAAKSETYSGLSEASYRSNRKRLQESILSHGFDFNAEDAIYALFLARRKNESELHLSHVGDELLTSSFFDPAESERLILLANKAVQEFGRSRFASGLSL